MTEIGRIGMIGVTALWLAVEGYRIDQERVRVHRRRLVEGRVLEKVMKQGLAMRGLAQVKKIPLPVTYSRQKKRNKTVPGWA